METQKQTTRSSRVLQTYMEATGLTVAEVAERSGLTRAFVYMVLNGQNEVGFRSALKFKAGLGIGLDKWVAESGNKNNVGRG